MRLYFSLNIPFKSKVFSCPYLQGERFFDGNFFSGVCM